MVGHPHSIPGDAAAKPAAVRVPHIWRRLSSGGSSSRTVALIAILAVLAGIVLLVRHGLRMHGIPFTFSFLGQTAGFGISEGVTVNAGTNGLSLAPFASQDTNLQALLCGFFNTVLVTMVTIVLCTVLGVLIGVGRLSSNLIIRQWSLLYVEVIRNTPLLIQLLFWYFAVVLQLPPVSRAMSFGGVLASRQGVSLPFLSAVATPAWWFVAAAVLLAALAILLPRSRRVVLPAWVGYAAAVLVAGVGVALYGKPLVPNLPEATRFSVAGGITVTPEMTGLVLALMVNSAAYIAEIVRGAIQSVAKGQWEAAAAVGLSRGDALRIIVLPQAVRVIIPSLGNQYVSLAKNTSLGIAIGFPDLFNVYGTVANQSGRALEGILLVMGVYLCISLTISGLVNIYNRRVMLQGAR
jgi:general L-amino acid transport system permease protein